MNDWRWKIPNTNQYIVFSDLVLEHFRRYKQIKRLSREAGGQLFAKIDGERVFIEFASGPYRGDFRCFFSYRSNPKKAQEVIDKEFKRGRIYIGEWHTHRESIPKLSQSDRDTIKDTLEYSKHPYESIILVIQGLNDLPMGLGVFIQGKNELIQLDCDN